MLTDAPGLLTADPRLDPSASLIEEIVEVDQTLEAVAGGAGTVQGSGGMASKIAAAKIAAWSGVRVVIAGADRPGVLRAAVAGEAGVGTVVLPRDRRLPARKLWIAFAVDARGTVVVDDGARRALCERRPIAAARRRRRRRGTVRRRRRRRARRPRPQGLRQGTRARRRQTCSRPSPAATPPIFPMASSTKSSTATTSSCCRKGGRLPVVGCVGSVAPLPVVDAAPAPSIGLCREPAPAVGLDVIDLALLGGHVTARRVGAMPITNLDGPAQRAREEALPHTDVDHP